MAAVDKDDSIMQKAYASFRIKQEKPPNCGTKDADVLDNFFSRQALMRFHWIPLNIFVHLQHNDFRSPIN